MTLISMPLDVSQIKAICFDVDGTLSDTDDQFVQKLAGWLSPFRFLIRGHNSSKIARKLVMLTEGPGNWAFGLADRIGLDNKISILSNRLYELGIGKSEHPFVIIEGVREMLITLSNKYLLGIVSARGARSTFRFLYQFGLSSLFVAVATGQTCRHTKPYPEPLEWVATKMGLSPTACLVVGDTSVDILMGKRAGTQTVGVLCGFGEKSELEKAGADLILESTPRLTDILLCK